MTGLEQHAALDLLLRRMTQETKDASRDPRLVTALEQAAIANDSGQPQLIGPALAELQALDAKEKPVRRVRSAEG